MTNNRARDERRVYPLPDLHARHLVIHPGSLFAKLEVRVARRRLFLRAIRPETHPFAPVSSTPASVLAGPAPASASAAAPAPLHVLAMRPSSASPP